MALLPAEFVETAMPTRHHATGAFAPDFKPMRRRALLGAFAALAVVGAAWVTSARANPADMVVTLETARAEAEAGRVVLIDIREPHEHANGVAAGAVLLPMSQIGKRLAEIPTNPAKPVLLICNTQNRSSATLRALRDRPGYSHVRFVHGGMSEWARRGWPMVPPSQ